MDYYETNDADFTYSWHMGHRCNERFRLVMKRVRWVFLSFVLLVSTSGASAQFTSQRRSSGSEDDDRIQWSLGGGLVASPRPYIGTDPKVFPIPVVGLRYKGWFVQGIRGGYEFLQKGAFTGSVFAQAQFKGLEPEDSPFLEGMAPRRKSADTGGELTYRGRPVGFRAAFVADMMGRSKGQELSLLAVTGMPLGKALVLFGAGPRWLSANRVDYYYGVRSDEARSWRPLYSVGGTWNLDVNVTVRLNLTEKWRLFALLNREGFGSSIRNSPLVDHSAAYSLITSLTYDF
jgi:outer membrane protein